MMHFCNGTQRERERETVPSRMNAMQGRAHAVDKPWRSFTLLCIGGPFRCSSTTRYTASQVNHYHYYGPMHAWCWMELALNYISAHLALLSCFSEEVSMYSLARKALVVHHGPRQSWQAMRFTAPVNISGGESIDRCRNIDSRSES
jgi:hypothetical protein